MKKQTEKSNNWEPYLIDSTQVKCLCRRLSAELFCLKKESHGKGHLTGFVRARDHTLSFRTLTWSLIVVSSSVFVLITSVCHFFGVQERLTNLWTNRLRTDDSTSYIYHNSLMWVNVQIYKNFTFQGQLCRHFYFQSDCYRDGEEWSFPVNMFVLTTG